MTSPKPLPEDFAIAKRPHFVLRDGQLFFMLSKRPLLALSDEEQQLWKALDETERVASLRERFGWDVDSAVARLIDSGVCELIQTSWPAARRRILVFEPHCDDAALSIGATMWAMRHRCEFTIVTMGGRSNFTSYFYSAHEYFDPDVVSALRDAEGDLFARCLGGSYLALPVNEATLRYQDGCWTREWYEQHKGSVTACTHHQADEAELARWRKHVRDVLQEHPSDEVWFPLAIGRHADHELTRDAVLDTLIANPGLARTREFWFYQDVPYVSDFPGHAQQILAALRRDGGEVEASSTAIDDVFDDKLRLLSLFASQFKLNVLQPEIEKSARSGAEGDSGLRETRLKLVTVPTSRDSLRMHLQYPLIDAHRSRYASWMRRSKDARRLRVLLLLPAGCLRADLDLLLCEFPSATIDVYVTPMSAPEARPLQSSRVRIHQVGRGTPAWVALAIRLALQRPALTVFLAGKRMEQAVLLARLWPGSSAIVMPSLDDFIRGLRGALRSTQQ